MIHLRLRIQPDTDVEGFQDSPEADLPAGGLIGQEIHLFRQRFRRVYLHSPIHMIPGEKREPAKLKRLMVRGEPFHDAIRPFVICRPGESVPPLPDPVCGGTDSKSSLELEKRRGNIRRLSVMRGLFARKRLVSDHQQGRSG